ncbi:cortex morphogenetic protein CmpA [Thermoactinomyces sp. DSM 45892]|uniref:cortex morphogenetic protein CmpA n=1 Tax=Thermoactinomyces sp. DSM 45892 TaxID=1882753 RepID=UPI000B8B4504|nr:cortex morphogenetic protein CmpA [Thermoactinomyces sp. DSM 45892]
MPKWLTKQLMNAYRQRDRKQVLYLNKCWFSYMKKEQDKSPSSRTQLGRDS